MSDDNGDEDEGSVMRLLEELFAGSSDFPLPPLDELQADVEDHMNDSQIPNHMEEPRDPLFLTDTFLEQHVPVQAIGRDSQPHPHHQTDNPPYRPEAASRQTEEGEESERKNAEMTLQQQPHARWLTQHIRNTFLSSHSNPEYQSISEPDLYLALRERLQERAPPESRHLVEEQFAFSACIVRSGKGLGLPMPFDPNLMSTSNFEPVPKPKPKRPERYKPRKKTASRTKNQVSRLSPGIVTDLYLSSLRYGNQQGLLHPSSKATQTRPG